MTQPYSEEVLLRLTAEAKELDGQLAELQPIANASRIGSPERSRYAELRERDAAAWLAVTDHVRALMAVTDDLRALLPEEEAE